MSLPISRVALSAALLGTALVPAFASTASAAPALAASSAGSCTSLPTTKAFAKIDGDKADYSLAPGGDFEVGGAAWTMSGGAKIVNGNESIGVATGQRALSLPIGGIATSPKFCVDETNPHFRFAFKVDGLGAGFLAKITYEAPSGLKSTQIVSSQQLKFFPSTWAASPFSPLATLLSLNGGNAKVQIQLIGTSVTGTINVTSLMSAGLVKMPSVTVDSVMVDPYRRS